ncbi:MAG: hypothetical protein SOT80_09160 [Candidatus Pseudoruminococcus sp.]|nr:hypothetical protein [Ruminococcus sp.]MDY2783545.1 hypothetical protein [Candidatus Pseudoruminococcus sp.]
MDFNNADYLNKFFTISLIILAPFIIYAEVSKVTDCKNRWKLAQEILNISKKSQKISELRDSLSKITSLTYLELFDINTDNDFDDNEEISISLYYKDKTIKYKISEKLNHPWIYSDIKIGKINSM